MKKNNNLTAKNKSITINVPGKGTRQRNGKPFPAPDPAPKEGEYRILPIFMIDPSPFNHRKIFPVRKMEELATSISIHGIIENLVVRLMPSGRYELVAGERRLRAAAIAGLKEVPVIIRALTDEQVREMQLAENLQREDAHPLEEAEAIAELQTRYKTLDEVALRLGKSKSFVYNRLKLNSLIPEIREMFIAEKINLQEALPIADLSADSQGAFYKDHCNGWQEQQHFRLHGLANILNQYLYDLSQAPFNKKDKMLVPEAGSCIKCPFNSSTAATLFPDEYQKGICRKGECFQRKCQAQLTKDLLGAVQKEQPAALLFYGRPSADIQKAIESVPELSALPVYNTYGITIIHQPEEPKQEDFIDEGEDGEGTELDPDAFNAAMEDYREELEEYNQQLQSGKIMKGLRISNNHYTEVCLFIPESSNKQKSRPIFRAAAVRAAIQEGRATRELLQGEIHRIQTKEQRSKELDAEKIQLKIHAAFSDQLSAPGASCSLTEADLVCARLLIFQSLNYSDTRTVREVLSLGKSHSDREEREDFFELLRQLTDEQFGYLIRVAMASRADSKSPKHASGYFLLRMAEFALVDTRAIRFEQDEIAATRQGRQQETIAQLQKKIDKLQTTA